MIPPLPRGVQLAVLALIALLFYVLIVRRLQRCPHCGSVVRRARRGWIRCRRCGRQYHRSVRPMNRH